MVTVLFCFVGYSAELEFAFSRTEIISPSFRAYPLDTTFLPLTKTLPPSMKGSILLLEVPKARAMISADGEKLTVPESSSLLGTGKSVISVMRSAFTDVWRIRQISL